jgi:hypothetical protein
MNDLLDWIARNHGAALVLAIFIAVVLSHLLNFFTNCIRALTGKYPPRPVVKCDCDVPCYCCRGARCQPGCGCYEDDEDDA